MAQRYVATVMDAVAVPSPAVLAVGLSAVDRFPIVDFRIPDLVDPLSTEGFLIARSRRTVHTTAGVAVEASEVSDTKLYLQHLGSARNFSGARGPYPKFGTRNTGRLSPSRVPALGSRQAKLGGYLRRRTTSSQPAFHFGVDTFTATAVPEPNSAAIFLVGICAMAA